MGNDAQYGELLRRIVNLESGLAAQGSGAALQATDRGLVVTDSVFNNVSITKHGFAPKSPNDATKFLNGQGAYSVPSSTDPSVVWPIGSVFLSAVATSPATLLGFGTWIQVAQGRAVFGEKSTDADFTPGGKTGGAKTLNLAHTHTGASTAATPDLVAADVTAAGVAEVTDSKLSATQSILNPYEIFYVWKRTA